MFSVNARCWVVIGLGQEKLRLGSRLGLLTRCRGRERRLLLADRGVEAEVEAGVEVGVDRVVDQGADRAAERGMEGSLSPRRIRQLYWMGFRGIMEAASMTLKRSRKLPVDTPVRLGCLGMRSFSRDPAHSSCGLRGIQSHLHDGGPLRNGGVLAAIVQGMFA